MYQLNTFNGLLLDSVSLEQFELETNTWIREDRVKSLINNIGQITKIDTELTFEKLFGLTLLPSIPQKSKYFDLFFVKKITSIENLNHLDYISKINSLLEKIMLSGLSSDNFRARYGYLEQIKKPKNQQPGMDDINAGEIIEKIVAKYQKIASKQYQERLAYNNLLFIHSFFGPNKSSSANQNKNEFYLLLIKALISRAFDNDWTAVHFCTYPPIMENSEFFDSPLPKGQAISVAAG
jgi:hypothetical protein